MFPQKKLTKGQIWQAQETKRATIGLHTNNRVKRQKKGKSSVNDERRNEKVAATNALASDAFGTFFFVV